MQTKLYNSYLEVDTNVLRNNILSIIESLPPETKLIPVLKADAFGLGLIPIAKICSEFKQIETIATAQIGEAVELRRADIDLELLIMGGCPSFLYPYVIEYDLTLAAGNEGLVISLASIAKTNGKKAKVEVKIETGLHRIGFKLGQEIDAFIDELENNKDYIEITGAFSHFADTNDEKRVVQQYTDFMRGVNQLKNAGIELPRIHICGSAAYEKFREYSLDAVRLGRRLYMDNPEKEGITEVKEVASFRGYITNLRKLKKGDTLGYSKTYSCTRDCLSATVGVGYGDGLNEALVKANAPVLINGKKAYLLGCCMDQCQIDVTDIECTIGDEVTFFGYDSLNNLLSSQYIAGLIGGNEGCGLTSALGNRVERIYI